MLSVEQNGADIQLILCPNRSATWWQTRWLILFICVFCGSIAVAWSLIGAWLVLPFAGLELSLFSLLMYRVNYASYQRQIITLSGATICVSQGVHQQREIWRSPRLDTQLNVHLPTHKDDSAQLFLLSGKKQLRIGAFLNKEDIESTRTALQQAGLMPLNNPWWWA